MGLADKQQCEGALKQTEYDVELAASLLLDRARWRLISKQQQVIQSAEVDTNLFIASVVSI